MNTDAEYANTDFDLKSNSPFDTLNREIDQACCVLHYTHSEDGNWHSIVEFALEDGESTRDAEMDILAIIDAIKSLSPTAKSELASCYLREFNIGFHCGDTWVYVHTLKSSIVKAVADTGCSIAVTLYPMRNPDGSPKE